MSQIQRNQAADTESTDSSWKSFYKLGGAVALIQLASTIVIIIVSFTLGLKPASAEEYFTLYQNDRLVGLLRDDFSSLIIIVLFAVTFLGLYTALKEVNHAYVVFATALIFIAVTISISAHSGFSMMHLSDQFAAAATEAQRAQFLAAGEAMIAADGWNSTAGFVAGLFLQGGSVLISVIMLKSQKFSKGTAYAGILANGFDLAHHIIIQLNPGVGEILGMIGGSIYLLWFPLLARDLFRLGQGVLREEEQRN